MTEGPRVMVEYC